MPGLEVVENLSELRFHRSAIQREHSIHDVVHAGFIRRVQIARFDGGAKRADDDSGRIRADHGRLPLDQRGVGQGALDSIRRVRKDFERSQVRLRSDPGAGPYSRLSPAYRKRSRTNSGPSAMSSASEANTVSLPNPLIDRAKWRPV